MFHRGFFSKSSKVDKKYKVGAELGSGNFAVVKKAELRKPEAGSDIPKEVASACSGQGPWVGCWLANSLAHILPFLRSAVKFIDKSKVEDMGDVEREVTILEKLTSPHIIRLYEIYDQPKQMCLVMELVNGGELFDRIVKKEHYSEHEAASATSTLCLTLAYMHENQVVHRDLKPENILCEWMHHLASCESMPATALAPCLTFVPFRLPPLSTIMPFAHNSPEQTRVQRRMRISRLQISGWHACSMVRM